MAEYQRIEYRIGKDGKIIETVIGASGPACTQTTTGMEAAIGEVEERKLLPEYDQEEDSIEPHSTQGLIQQ